MYNCNFITEQTGTCFGHSCCHFQGGDHNNTNTIIMCRNYPKVENRTVYAILVILTLKMATWVAGPCRWLQCNKTTFVYPSSFVCSFQKCY